MVAWYVVQKEDVNRKGIVKAVRREAICALCGKTGGPTWVALYVYF